MKTRIVISLLAIGLLGLAGTAQAGDRHHGYRDSGHHRGYATQHYRPAKHHGRHYGTRHGRHYAPRYRNVYGHRHYRPYYYHHDYYRAHKVAAGAVLLGSIINAATYDRSARVVYVERTPQRVVTRSVSGEAWYQTDSSGDCFEVRLDGNGEETWTYVDPSYCR